jgi:hypothetical protein
MAKINLPTLKHITGERPRCQYCNEELCPLTEYVEVGGHITSVPTVDELLRMPQPKPTYPSTNDAIRFGYQAAFVFRMQHKRTFKEEPYTRISFWTGKFGGYGYTDTPKLFCNNDCGRLFGLAAWRAGYRMKGRTDWLICPASP